MPRALLKPGYRRNRPGTDQTVRIGVATFIYLVIGVVVASNEKYLRDVDTLREIVSALLAIALWPLLLLGVDLRVRG